RSAGSRAARASAARRSGTWSTNWPRAGSSRRDTTSRAACSPAACSWWHAAGTLLDQAVELPRVLAGDLLDDVLREMAELLLDVLRGLRPDAVRVRVVGR